MHFSVLEKLDVRLDRLNSPMYARPQYKRLVCFHPGGKITEDHVVSFPLTKKKLEKYVDYTVINQTVTFVSC